MYCIHAVCTVGAMTAGQRTYQEVPSFYIAKSGLEKKNRSRKKIKNTEVTAINLKVVNGWDQ